MHTNSYRELAPVGLDLVSFYIPQGTTGHKLIQEIGSTTIMLYTKGSTIQLIPIQSILWLISKIKYIGYMKIKCQQGTTMQTVKTSRLHSVNRAPRQG